MNTNMKEKEQRKNQSNNIEQKSNEQSNLANEENNKQNNLVSEETKKEKSEKEKLEKEKDDLDNERIREYGQMTLVNEERKSKIHLLSIIGEVEGHESLPTTNKSTKYEHVLPQLAAIEDSSDIDGVLIIINTVGGDVEAGLAIAEMIASLSKPTVSLVLGGSHSIGVPLAVSADYSFIVASGTMIIHPVRMNGTVIGVAQTYEYFEKIQERITNFVVTHSSITKEEFRALMLDTKQLAKDVGSILIGDEAVVRGIIDEVGGIKEALSRLNQMIGKSEEVSED